MPSVFNYLTNLGVRDSYSIEEQHMVRHSNVLSIVTGTIYVGYVFYGLYISSLFTSVLAAILAIMIGVVFWMNSTHRHGASKILASLASNFSVWFAHHVFPIDNTILTTFFPIVASYIYLYNPKKERLSMMTSFLIAIVAILASLMLPRHVLYFVDLSPEVVAMSNTSHIFISLGLMMILLIAVVFTKNSMNTSLKLETDRAQEALGKLVTTQERVVEAEKMAMLGFLSAGLNHEINNPLTFMFGALDNLEKNVNGSGDKDSIEVLREGMNRINEIVSSLRNFTYQSDYTDHDCEINKILETCSTMIRSGQQDMALLKDFTLESTVVKGNTGRLHQLFLNLLINATQAVSDGGMITVKTYREKDKLHVEIGDNGKGINEKDLPHVFDPFFTTRFPGEGTGLGLSIAKSIVNEHYGEIDISTNEGSGVTVAMTLPLTPPE